MHDNVLKHQAAIFKALGHPSRLLMAKALADGEKCVCELQTLVGADMSTISKHLAVLKSVGVVDTEKRGSNVYYKLKLCCLGRVIACLDACALNGGQSAATPNSPVSPPSAAEQVCAVLFGNRQA